MGKKVKTTTKKAAAAVTKTVEPVEEVEVAADSASVAQKKANDLKIKKQLKAMNAQVVSKVDLKQVVSAVKALKAFTKKHKH